MILCAFYRNDVNRECAVKEQRMHREKIKVYYADE